MESRTEICQASALFDKLKKSAFHGFNSCEFHATFPEYLPPVLLPTGTEECILQAAAAIRQCASPGDTLLASAFYEDHRNPADCCVVLLLELKRENEANLCVESSWLDAMGSMAEELLARSVALSISASEHSLTFEFRLAVHPMVTRRRHHRNAILLVEDDAFVRHSSREVLEMRGYRVAECGSAEEAETLYASMRDTVALVVSDVSLPGRDGRDLARTLHRDVPGLPILLVSGYATPRLENAPQHVFYLAKPYNSQKLIDAVERCLAAREIIVPAAASTSTRAEATPASC